jgi:hypothetical protein
MFFFIEREHPIGQASHRTSWSDVRQNIGLLDSGHLKVVS